MLNFSITSKHLNPDGPGLRLLPEDKTFHLTMPIGFKIDGCWDIDRAMQAMTQDFLAQSGWRIGFGLLAGEDASFMHHVQDTIVAQVIQAEEDVLGQFSLRADGGDGGIQGSALPLIMADTRRLLEMEVRIGAQGNLDASPVLPCLEQCYSDIFYLRPGMAVFSPAQTAEINEQASAWLMRMALEAGLWAPAVELDTSGGTWEGMSLRLWVRIPGQTEEIRKLMVPVSDRGVPDYANMAKLARSIAREWGRRFELNSVDKLYNSIVTSLRPQVEEYVEWIIEIERAPREAFWRGLYQAMREEAEKAQTLVQEMDKVLAEAKAHAEDMVAINSEIKEPTNFDAWDNMKATPSKVWDGLVGSLGKIYDGLTKLPGQVKEGISPHLDEIGKGLLFSFSSAGFVVGYTFIFFIARDVAAAYSGVGATKMATLLGKHVFRSGLSNKLMSFIVNRPDWFDVAAQKLFDDPFSSFNDQNFRDHAESIDYCIKYIHSKIYD